jgi:hypothetical protein
VDNRPNINEDSTGYIVDNRPNINEDFVIKSTNQYKKPLLKYVFNYRSKLKEELKNKHKINYNLVDTLFKGNPIEITESLLKTLNKKTIKSIITEGPFKCSIDDVEKRAKKIIFVKYNWDPKNVVFGTENNAVQITAMNDLKPELQQGHDDVIFGFLESLSKKYGKDLNNEFNGFCNKIKMLSSFTTDITSSVYCYTIIKQSDGLYFLSSNREKKKLKRSDNPQYLLNKLYFKIGLFANNVKLEGLNLPKKNLNTPEAWFQDILNNLDPRKNPNYPDSIFYKLNDNIVMEIEITDQDTKSGNLYYDYNQIYKILRNKFNMEPNEIHRLVKSMVEKHFKLGSLTPTVPYDIYDIRWKNISNWGY